MLRVVWLLVLMGLQLLDFNPARVLAEEASTQMIKQTQGAVGQVLAYDAAGKLFKRGSGFFVSPEGHFVTRRNMITGAPKIVIKLGEQEFPVKAVLGEERIAELVELLIEPANTSLPFLVVTAALPDPGARVLAMGRAPKGEFIVTEGMVSSIQDFAKLGKVVQISAEVAGDARGGPVVNQKGEVIGVAGSGTRAGHDFYFATPGSRALELQSGPAQPLTEYFAAHMDETVADYLNRAADQMKANHLADALLSVQSALRVKPDQAQAHYLLAEVYLKSNKTREAEKELAVLNKLDAKLAERLKAGLAAAAPKASSFDLPELTKRIKPAVLYVEVRDRQGRPLRYGSGFFVNAKGNFITNYHVLRGASLALVKTADGKWYPITRIVAEDQEADLILAAIVPEVEMPYLQVSGALPEIGEHIVVVGNPKGLQWSVADGIVSAIRENVPGEGKSKKFIQITAPISPGSSGGPLLNMKGQVIGINTLQFREGQLLNFSSAGQNVLALKRGPGLTLEERAEGWTADAKEHLRQGIRAMQAKQFQKGLTHFVAAQELAPELSEVYYHLCVAYLAIGKEQEASEAMANLRKLNPPLAQQLVDQIKAAQKDSKRK